MLDVQIAKNQITSGDPVCDTFPAVFGHGSAGGAAQFSVNGFEQHARAAPLGSQHSRLSLSDLLLGSSALHGRPGGGGSRRGPLVSSDPTPRRQHVLSSATLANAARAIAGSTLLSARAVRH